jgi:hypothetical protein
MVGSIGNCETSVNPYLLERPVGQALQELAVVVLMAVDVEVSECVDLPLLRKRINKCLLSDDIPRTTLWCVLNYLTSALALASTTTQRLLGTTTDAARTRRHCLLDVQCAVDIYRCSDRGGTFAKA